MTLSIKGSPGALARVTFLLLVLSGCASVPPQGDPSASPESTTAAFPSLRISDIPASPTLSNSAGTPSIKRPTTGATSSPGLADKSLPILEVPTPPALPHAIDLTYEPDDLFQRIRNGFAMPDINNDLVLQHQQWYLNRPDYLRRMVERSSLYLFHIVNEIDKRDMPTELALLPMVESAYNPMAYSRAKASGLWQFIPSTGKRYNLDQNWWKDERRDIVASTAAALDYLQSIYDMHGDWQLALASYNWGEGAVGRAVNKNKTQGLNADYLSLNMPGETKNYVPKLQALKNIFSDPALMASLNLPHVPNRPYFGTVTKMANIDVKVAAKLAEMPVQDFVALNPSSNRPVIKSDTALNIPADKLDTFMSNVEAHEESNKPLSSWQTYTLRPGDKLDKVARRFGMTVAELKAVNGLTGRTKAKPGLSLLVAGSDGGASLDDATLAEKPLAEEPAPTAKIERTSHTVRKGETLAAIAKRYGLSVAELKQINHLRTNKVSAGQRLVVSSAAAPSTPPTQAQKEPNQGKAATTKSAANSAAKNDKKSPKTVYYTVRRGDTLSSIARQYKVDVDDLQRWNKISPAALKPGKKLTIRPD